MQRGGQRARLQHPARRVHRVQVRARARQVGLPLAVRVVQRQRRARHRRRLRRLRGASRGGADGLGEGGEEHVERAGGVLEQDRVGEAAQQPRDQVALLAARRQEQPGMLLAPARVSEEGGPRRPSVRVVTPSLTPLLRCLLPIPRESSLCNA
eukprot:7318209-Pyramimonas_sp.AAC.2